MSLYHKYRPGELSGVLGQEKAVAVLEAKAGDLPHVVLLSGPTGSGKTTIARILARTAGCDMGVANLHEVNCADVRGIDSVREMSNLVPYLPLGGKARVWILDEVVQLPRTTQQAMLKLLEEVPRHAYFFLCTTDKSGLLPTFLGRCFEVSLDPLPNKAMEGVIAAALRGEGEKTLPVQVISTLIGAAGGDARKALNLLETVLAVKTPARQLELLQTTVKEEEGEFLARTLIFRRDWPAVQKSLEKVSDSDTEGLRRQTLAYACKVLLGHDKNTRAVANAVIKALQFSFAEGGKAALAAACFSLCFSGRE